MGHSYFVSLIFAIVVWTAAYIAVAVLASFRAVSYLCTTFWTPAKKPQFRKTTMGYAQLVIGPAGSGKVKFIVFALFVGKTDRYYVHEANFFLCWLWLVYILLEFVPTLWNCATIDTYCEPWSCCWKFWLSCCNG